jgi:hypothetical protein
MHMCMYVHAIQCRHVCVCARALYMHVLVHVYVCVGGMHVMQYDADTCRAAAGCSRQCDTQAAGQCDR